MGSVLADVFLLLLLSTGHVYGGRFLQRKKNTPCLKLDVKVKPGICFNTL